jgi:flagellar biosynthesis protein FlhG
MSDEEYRRYLDVLELPADASLTEIKSAYQQLKEIYSSDSIAISSIANEFPESSRQKVLQQLEEVYKKLLAHFDAVEKGVTEDFRPQPQGVDQMKEFVKNIVEFTGPVLRDIRERRSFELHDLALSTKIRKGYLHDIETENFTNLPSEIYLKGYLIVYAQYLSLDPKKVCDDYMRRYREWALTKK